MSRWVEQFKSNQIHQTIEQLIDWSGVKLDKIDGDIESERRRLQKALSAVRDLLNGLDPEVCPIEIIDKLNNNFRQLPIWANLQAYSSNPTVQYLIEANNSLSAILPIIFQISAFTRRPEARDEITKIENAYDEFCTSLSNSEGEIQIKIINFTERLNGVENDAALVRESLKELEKSTENTLSTWQAEYTTSQTERAEAYSKAQIDRETKFEATLRELREKAEKEVRDISEKYFSTLNLAFEKYKDEASTLIGDMNEKHEQILQIHGLVGTDGVAGGYQKGAKEEHDAANLWRKISMGTLLITAAWILLKYFLGFDLTVAGQTNWAEIITAASLTLVLLGAAGYASKQSKLHRDTEQHLRWFALEVKAIDPFLSSLPEEQRNDLKNQLSQKLFGQNRLTSDNNDGSIDPAAFKSITDLVLNVIKATGRN